MAFGVAKHGVNAIVYLSGAELEGANAWSLSIETQSADYLRFGSNWVERVAGANDWSGNLGAVHDQDAQKLQLAAIARTLVDLMLYPDRDDATTYFSGQAIFSFGTEVGTDAAISQTSDFVGSGSLTIVGFS